MISIGHAINYQNAFMEAQQIVKMSEALRDDNATPALSNAIKKLARFDVDGSMKNRFVGMQSTLVKTQNQDLQIAQIAKANLIENAQVLCVWSGEECTWTLNNVEIRKVDLQKIFLNDDLESLRALHEQNPVLDLKYFCCSLKSGDFALSGLSLAAYCGSLKVTDWLLKEKRLSPNFAIHEGLKKPLIPAWLATSLSPLIEDDVKIAILRKFKMPFSRMDGNRYLRTFKDISVKVLHELLKMANNIEEAYPQNGESTTSIMDIFYQYYRLPNSNLLRRAPLYFYSDSDSFYLFKDGSECILSTFFVLLYHGLGVTKEREKELSENSLRYNNFQLINEYSASSGLIIRQEETARLFKEVESGALSQNPDYNDQVQFFSSLGLYLDVIKGILSFSFPHTDAGRILIAQRCFDRTFTNPFSIIAEELYRLKPLLENDLKKFYEEWLKLIGHDKFKQISLKHQAFEKKIRPLIEQISNYAQVLTMKKGAVFFKCLDLFNNLTSHFAWAGKLEWHEELESAITSDDLVKAKRLVKTHKLDVISFRVKADADQNFVAVKHETTAVSETDFNLHSIGLAVYRGAEKVMHWLLKEYKVSPNASQRFSTPAIFPAWLVLGVAPMPTSKKITILKELQKYDVDLFLKDSEGKWWLEKIAAAFFDHEFLHELLMGTNESTDDVTKSLCFEAVVNYFERAKKMLGRHPALLTQLTAHGIQNLAVLTFHGFTLSKTKKSKLNPRAESAIDESLSILKEEQDKLSLVVTVLKSPDQYAKLIADLCSSFGIAVEETVDMKMPTTSTETATGVSVGSPAITNKRKETTNIFIRSVMDYADIMIPREFTLKVAQNCFTRAFLSASVMFGKLLEADLK